MFSLGKKKKKKCGWGEFVNRWLRTNEDRALPLLYLNSHAMVYGVTFWGVCGEFARNSLMRQISNTDTHHYPPFDRTRTSLTANWILLDSSILN